RAPMIMPMIRLSVASATACRCGRQCVRLRTWPNHCCDINRLSNSKTDSFRPYAPRIASTRRAFQVRSCLSIMIHAQLFDNAELCAAAARVARDFFAIGDDGLAGEQ